MPCSEHPYRDDPDIGSARDHHKPVQQNVVRPVVRRLRAAADENQSGTPPAGLLRQGGQLWHTACGCRTNTDVRAFREPLVDIKTARRRVEMRMLVSKGDHFVRYLDFRAAEVGDEFWSVAHTPYGNNITSIKHFLVTAVTKKLAVCAADDGEFLRLRRNSEQENCYLDGDPLFRQLMQDFSRQSTLSTIKTLIRDADIDDFDQEFLDACAAWVQRVRGHRRP